MQRIPDEILDAPVSGVNLMPGSLRAQLADRATLLVFLRHFGCIFCRETVAELRAASAAPDFPPVIFFFQGSPTEGRAFLRRDWPDVRAVADPGGRFYEAFGVGRMSPLQMLRPGLWAAERRARSRGFENGPRSGDIWRMPGVFLVQGDRVRWKHDFRHAGDAPDFGALPALARRLDAEAGGAPGR
ncbi:MAG: peroxiredoxin-like family protein [Myxococcota bacterium]|nr:peroxiredoxin-like family protein [Myxococcota bacterium]